MRRDGEGMRVGVCTTRRLMRNRWTPSPSMPSAASALPPVRYSTVESLTMRFSSGFWERSALRPGSCPLVTASFSSSPAVEVEEALGVSVSWRRPQP